MLLSVDDLAVAYRTSRGDARAVDGARLDLPQGALLGLVGEFGCGKTTLARAIMGVLPRNGSVRRGRIVFDGIDLLSLPPERRRALLWRDISFVPQIGDELARSRLSAPRADARGAVRAAAACRDGRQTTAPRNCSPPSASTRRGSRTIRTNSAAACASAPPSRSRSR